MARRNTDFIFRLLLLLHFSSFKDFFCFMEYLLHFEIDLLGVATTNCNFSQITLYFDLEISLNYFSESVYFLKCQNYTFTFDVL